ncbi:MAG: sensor histidine kinase [Candidatus Kapaibacterium sp.]
MEPRITDDFITPMGDARAYVGHLPEASILFRSDGTILAANDEATSLLRMSATAICATILHDLIVESGGENVTVSQFLERTLLPLTRKSSNVFRVRPSMVRIEARTLSVHHTGSHAVYLVTLSGVPDRSPDDEYGGGGSAAVSERDAAGVTRGRFIETFSHEFRTPLTVIRSSTDLLLRYRGQLTDEQRERYLHIIQEQVNVLSRLVHDALSVADTAEAMQVERRTTALGGFLDSLMRQCKDVPAGSTVIRIINEWPEENIDIDEHLLRLALCNILSNAVRYSSRKGDVLLHVVRDGDDLVMTVTDHGRGIPAKDLPDVFDAYFRASNVQDVHGVGLGLTLARDFVRSHAGSVSIESREGAGTTVVVRIPQP